MMASVPAYNKYAEEVLGPQLEKYLRRLKSLKKK
jgi:hypothetical protein